MGALTNRGATAGAIGSTEGVKDLIRFWERTNLPDDGEVLGSIKVLAGGRDPADREATRQNLLLLLPDLRDREFVGLILDSHPVEDAVIKAWLEKARAGRVPS